MLGHTTGRHYESTAVNPDKTVHSLSLLSQFFVVSIIALLSVGCPAVIQHQPNERMVDELGVPQARQRLQDTLTRSINPQVVEVEVTDDYLNYRYRQPILGPYGIVMGTTMAENRIFFNNVHRVEVFENGVVLVRAQTEHILAQMIFSNTNDSKNFADLLMSFRARRARTAR